MSSQVTPTIISRRHCSNALPQITTPPRTTRASARAREESNKHLQATSSYSQLYRKTHVASKPTSMSVDRLPPFLNDPNATSKPPCQSYEPAEADAPLPKQSRSLVDRCYVLLTPLKLKKTSSSSERASQNHVSPIHPSRSTHTRTSQRKRGEPVSGVTSSVTKAGHEPDEPQVDEAHVSSKQDSNKRGPPRNVTRRGGKSQSHVPEPSREVQIAPGPAGIVSHVLDLIFDLATSALAIMGVCIVFVLAWHVYHSLNHSSCAVFCFVPA